MRTALILLFLLAVASVPGSLFPQQGVDPASVQQYYAAHPALAPLLGKLGLFNVFAAPWFAAIYLLLFASLVGCVLPRTYRLARSGRTPPPRAPRNLARLPFSARHETALAPEAALAAASGLLRGRRFRLAQSRDLAGDGWVSAEKGYRREAGNLLFHIALTGVLVSISLGGLYGYKADKLLVEGQSFADTVTALDEYHPGRLVTPADLPPFTLTLDNFTARYITSGSLREQPSYFDAHISYSAQPGGTVRSYNLEVNHPLSVDSTKVYLLGHGYAPVFKVTDARGRVVYNAATPFLPADQASYLSEGVVKVPDAQPSQLGFIGVFLPTAVDVGGQLESMFPAANNPAVSLIAYSGNLGMDSGVAQSVYQLNTNGMHRLSSKPVVLTVGQSEKLPGGRTISFTGYRQWVSLQVTHDPGQLPALLFAVAALIGLLLSFLVRRRRVFVRAYAGESGGCVVEVGGLARTDVGGGFDAEFAGLAADLESATQGALPSDEGSSAGESSGEGEPVPAADQPVPVTHESGE
jgi:cytochrome c biogenesis protein